MSDENANPEADDPPCLWAHSARISDGRRHALADHLDGTATLAEHLAAPFQAGPLARYSGLVHDVGKGANEWQARLLQVEAEDLRRRRVGDDQRKSRVGIDHKLAGSWLAWSVPAPQRAAGRIVAQIVHGHHGRIAAFEDMDELFDPERPASGLTPAARGAIDRVKATMPEIVQHASLLRLPPWIGDVPKPELLAVRDLLARMVASTVYDADVLDTRQFEHAANAPDLYAGPVLADLATRLEQRRASIISGKTSPVASVREELAALARDAASERPGIVRMAFPTGAGKTMSAARFAVHHAVRWGHRRIIYAAPFLSITTQNADVLRDLFGDELVLEHHSSADLDRLVGAGLFTGRNPRPVRQIAENWDMPVVVTTMVQLFESLFSNRPGALRKVHRLAGSVLVLDEVQSLPDRLLLPILSALRHLVKYFGTTVVLCTATQPAFDALPPLRDLAETDLIRDVVRETGKYAKTFRRVTYRWRLDPKPTLADIAEEAATLDKVLVIVNTTRDAAQVHRALAAAGRADALHLSTRMGAAHRADVLQQVRERLHSGQPVCVVSTQLVEAGVDVDFPTVYRAWAPAEALCQAAGRANREGILEKGLVVIFDPFDGGQPPGYITASDVARHYFGPELAEPDDPEALAAYYRARFMAKGVGAQAGGQDIERARSELDFPEVQRRFRMIDDFGISVVVNHHPDAKDAARLDGLLHQARSPFGSPTPVLRELQPWMATIPQSLAVEALRRGDAEVVVGDLLLWRAFYHSERGIEGITGVEVVESVF